MRSDARKRLTENADREAANKPQPHPDPAVCELIARAWDEGHRGCSCGGALCSNPYPYRSAS